MPPYHPPRKLIVVLMVNAGLLAALLWAIVGRGPAIAGGQVLPAATGGVASRNSGGMTVMPAQITSNTYGCFILDGENQTLSVYQFLPGETTLRLVAARDVQYDRRLAQFNTSPPPSEVQKLVDDQGKPSRAAPAGARSPEPADRR